MPNSMNNHNKPSKIYNKLSRIYNRHNMKSETKNRIFEQGFTTKEVGKGTCLGMAIAYQIITDKHGGTITCDSTIGQGTTFTIVLPITG
ncbi:MAG: sensor histidine kinase [Symploca sp. SIO2C1]|nr:sensor histidine kinase [Symploca sp. SIO2C1]